MPLVPGVISRLRLTVPVETRHCRDIVQACPGGGPVIPNQSLAMRRSEREIKTREFRFFFVFSLSLSLFLQCMLNPKYFFSFLALFLVLSLYSDIYTLFPSFAAHFISHSFLISFIFLFVFYLHKLFTVSSFLLLMLRANMA